MSIKYPTTILFGLILVCLVTYSCDRGNFEVETTEVFETPDPEVIYDSTSSSYFLSDGSRVPLSNGKGLVGKGLTKAYFMEVILTVQDREEPFAMGWEGDRLEPGSYQGEIFFIDLENGQTLESGPTYPGAGEFTVKLESIGAIGDPMIGTFEGEASPQGASGGGIPFSGAFNVIRKQ